MKADGELSAWAKLLIILALSVGAWGLLIAFIVLPLLHLMAWLTS